MALFYITIRRGTNHNSHYREGYAV